jgi:kinesin family protein 11
LDSLGTGNHQAAKSFQEQVKGRVQTAENKLNHFIAEQTRKFAELHSSIDAFVGQKDAEVEQVQRNIINLENLVIGHVQSIGKIAATYSADAAGKLDHYESSQDYHQEEFERKINAFTSDIRESFGQLGETIRLHRASVASWTAEKKQAIEANINTARYFIEKNNEKISEIASMADDHSIRQVASLYAHQESLADFLENQVAQSNKFQNDLIAQVTDMIVGFVRKQNESTSTVVGSIKSALAASQKETTAFKTGIDAKTDSAKFSATQFSNEFSKTQTDLIDSITQQDVNAGSFSVVVVDKIENLHSNVDTQSQCVIQHGRKRVGDLKKYVDVIKSSTAGFMSDHAAKVEQTLLDSSTQIETDLVESLRRHQTSMKEWLNNYNSEVSTTKCVSESFGADYNEYSHFTREQIAAFGLQEYAPTGATPQKKHYEHPTNLARTKPKHVLVQEYRRLKLSGGVNLSSMDNIDSIDQLPSTISSLHSSVDESGSGVASEDENPLADEVSSNGSTGSSISMKETPPVAVSAKAATIIPGKMLPPTMPAKAAAKKSATAAVEVKRVASSTSMATQNQLVKNSSGALAKKPSNTTIVNKKPALQRSASKTTLGDATNKL